MVRDTTEIIEKLIYNQKRLINATVSDLVGELGKYVAQAHTISDLYRLKEDVIDALDAKFCARLDMLESYIASDEMVNQKNMELLADCRSVAEDIGKGRAA